MACMTYMYACIHDMHVIYRFPQLPCACPRIGCFVNICVKGFKTCPQLGRAPDTPFFKTTPH